MKNVVTILTILKYYIGKKCKQSYNGSKSYICVLWDVDASTLPYSAPVDIIFLFYCNENWFVYMSVWAQSFQNSPPPIARWWSTDKGRTISDVIDFYRELNSKYIRFVSVVCGVVSGGEGEKMAGRWGVLYDIPHIITTVLLIYVYWLLQACNRVSYESNAVYVVYDLRLPSRSRWILRYSGL